MRSLDSAMVLFAPLLSEKDEALSTEGAIDPLGLYAIADTLAVKLAPGVRERQKRPRFLTAMAVAHVVCDGLAELASDNVSPPWQVFEWYTVEGLARRDTDDLDIRSLPGIDKARRAIEDGLHLSAPRYLKAPSIFGFHGVYRLLAREIGVEQSDHLGEVGHELLETWSAEQGLRGFLGSGDGEGRRRCVELRKAVIDGLEAGGVKRGARWAQWHFFADHLAPGHVGRREAQVLIRALKLDEKGFREPVIGALMSKRVRRRLLEGDDSERGFHQVVRDSADPDLTALLDAIGAYETWSRLLQDAFDDCLLRLSEARARMSARALAESVSAKLARDRTPNLFAELCDRLEPFGEASRFHTTFSSLGERLSPTDWMNQLLAHHRRVQGGKPPNGKNPWLEQFDDGSYMVRPGYIRSEGGLGDDTYVHGYRTFPLASFVRDLENTD